MLKRISEWHPSVGRAAQAQISKILFRTRMARSGYRLRGAALIPAAESNTLTYIGCDPKLHMLLIAPSASPDIRSIIGQSGRSSPWQRDRKSVVMGKRGAWR